MIHCSGCGKPLEFEYAHPVSIGTRRYYVRFYLCQKCFNEPQNLGVLYKEARK